MDRLHFISIRYKDGDVTREATVTLRDDYERHTATVRVEGIVGVVKVTRESYTIPRGTNVDKSRPNDWREDSNRYGDPGDVTGN